MLTARKKFSRRSCTFIRARTPPWLPCPEAKHIGLTSSIPPFMLLASRTVHLSVSLIPAQRFRGSTSVCTTWCLICTVRPSTPPSHRLCCVSSPRADFATTQQPNIFTLLKHLFSLALRRDSQAGRAIGSSKWRAVSWRLRLLAPCGEKTNRAQHRLRGHC